MTAPIAEDLTVAVPEPTAPVAESAAPTKKKSPGLGPRWSYVITRGLIVTIVWAFFAFVFDPLLRMGAIESGQAATGARVDVGNLQTGFFPPRIVVEQVEIANPNKRGINLAAFELMEGDVSGFGLLKGSYIVDKAVITGLTWNTPRGDDGMLDVVETPVEEDSSSIDFGKLEEFGKEWADDLLKRAQLEYDPRNLETVQLAEQYQVEWKSEFDGLEFRIKEIDGQYKKLEDLFRVAKGGKPLEKLDQYRKLTDEASRLLREVSTVRQELQKLPGQAKIDLGELNSARQRDQVEIERRVRELVLDPDQLADFLLGPALHQQVKQTVSWIQWANRRIEKFSSDPKPERLRGEDILFDRDVVLPKYLIRLVEVTGRGKIGGDLLDVSGTIQDVTTEPGLYGRPTVINLEGHGDVDVQLRAEIDRTGEQALNRFNVVYDLPEPVTSRLGHDGTLVVQVQAEKTSWHASVQTVDDNISGRLVMTQKPVVMTSMVREKTDERLKHVIAASVRDIKRIEASVQLSGTVRHPRWKIHTNLGTDIARGVKQGVGEELSAQKDALVAKLNSRFTEKHSELVGQFNDRYKDSLGKLDGKQAEIQKLIPNLAGKPLDPTKLFR